MKEIWKQLPFDTLYKYEVSNLGRFRRTNKQGKIIYKTNNSTKGYERVSLRYSKKKVISYAIHRLVAMMFVDGKTNFKKYVNHKDFNKRNNKANNLEWVTIQENNQHYIDAIKNNVSIIKIKKNQYGWYGQVYHNGKTHYTNYFKTKDEAIIKYDELLKSLDINEKIV